MIVASPFFLIGWLIGKAWLIVTWCLAAIKVGWQDARA